MNTKICNQSFDESKYSIITYIMIEAKIHFWWHIYNFVDTESWLDNLRILWLDIFMLWDHRIGLPISWSSLWRLGNFSRQRFLCNQLHKSHRRRSFGNPKPYYMDSNISRVDQIRLHRAACKRSWRGRHFRSLLLHLPTHQF